MSESRTDGPPDAGGELGDGLLKAISHPLRHRLLAMLGCSALYNLTPEGGRKRLFRRLDHAAIFLMIAGTYAPFTLVEIAGTWGTGLLAFVWTVAGVGIAVELLGLGRHDGLSVAAYLLLGWSVLAVRCWSMAAAAWSRSVAVR